jgi:hypothetical protein
MFFPIPPVALSSAPPVSPAAMLPRPPLTKPPEPIAQPRRPAHDVRMMPAISAEEAHAARRRALYAVEQAKVLGKVPPPRPWYEDPVALGTLLIVVPPIGLAALWSSKRYSNDARLALTLMTALTLCLGVVLTIAVLALRSQAM